MDERFHAFVSYAGAEVSAARRLARELEPLGVRLWLASDQGAPTGTWSREVIDLLRRVPATVLLVGEVWPPAGWRMRELGEIARRKMTEPSFRFVVVLLPGATMPRELPVAPDAVVPLDEGWGSPTLARVAEALAPGPDAAAITLSHSVEAAVAVEGEVSAFVLARRLLEAHREYVRRPIARELAAEPDDATYRTAAEWVAGVRGLYDGQRTDVLDGRKFIDGLARLDQALRKRLQDLGALDEVRRGIDPPVEQLLRAKPESVRTLTDYPADVDDLGRMVIAEVLARRIRAMREDEVRHHQRTANKALRRGGHFLLHLYGPWGAGKTSLLRFLRDELERRGDETSVGAGRALGERARSLFRVSTWRERLERTRGALRRLFERKSETLLPERWVVIDFNAWQHQRIVPPWWWLMSAVYRQGSRALWRIDKRRWLALRLWDAGWRIRAAAPGLLLAATGILIAWLVWKSGSFDKGQEWGSIVSATESVVKALSGVIALCLTVWGGVRALGRWLVVGSPRVAGSFLTHAKDPLETMSRRFRALVHRIYYPVAIFVDDLDRCQAKFVVELLEGIQTLFSQVPVAYVVAADREWLCQSYVEQYPGFSETIGEPGRPMGYLFLEKTFQLSAPVPTLSTDTQRDFFNGLLRVTRPALQTELREARIRARGTYEDLEDEADVQEELRRSEEASPIERQAAAEAAVLRLAQPDVEERTAHALEAFAPLLERNPRSMKRLVNAYGMARASEIIRGVRPTNGTSNPSERIALWTILSLRWPLLADYLAENDDAADRMRAGEDPPEEPAWLGKLWRDPEVLDVLEGRAPTVTTKLDSEAVRLCVGKVATGADNQS